VSRLSRFLHLERARSTGPAEAEPSTGTAERFEGVQQPGRAPEAPRSSGADLDRFGPEPPPRVDLLETASDAQPFKRCMRCGMDHGVFATACTNCGERLDTPAQREFNEKLWGSRREEAAREEAASAERRVLAERAQAEMARAQRAMGEELAREVGDRERLRLRVEGGSWGGGSESSLSAPIGLRLLRALPDWRWQLGAAASSLAVLGGLTAVGLSGHPGALLAAILLGILLFVPGWRVDGP
jgi:hypothetical protein